jgi:hypothetical protein
VFFYLIAGLLESHSCSVSFTFIRPDLLQTSELKFYFSGLLPFVPFWFFHAVIGRAQNSVILISAKVYGMTSLAQSKSKGRISPGVTIKISGLSL